MRPNTVLFWDQIWKNIEEPKVCVSHQEIAKMLPEKGKVLDVGCGLCELFDEVKMRRPKLKLTGIDFSRTAVARGKKNEYNVIRKSVPPLPFKDNEFDVVIGSGILEHVKQDWQLFEEIERVGKQLILTVPENEPLDHPMIENGEHIHIYRNDDFSGYKTKKLYDKFPRMLVYSPSLVKKQGYKRVFLVFSGYGGFKESFVTSLLNMYMGVTNSILATPKKGKSFEFKLPAYAESLPSVWLYCSTPNLNKTKDTLGNGLLATDCDYMMIIDADLRFPANGIHRLILDDKDVVAGFYVKRGGGGNPTMGHNVPKRGIHLGKDYPDNELFDNYNGYKLVLPTGFTLIKRDVIIAMEYPRFVYINNIIGTDWSFCLRASKLGFGVWCDSRVKLTHVGDKEYKAEEYFERKEKNKKRMVK